MSLRQPAAVASVFNQLLPDSGALCLDQDHVPKSFQNLVTFRRSRGSIAGATSVSSGALKQSELLFKMSCSVMILFNHFEMNYDIIYFFVQCHKQLLDFFVGQSNICPYSDDLVLTDCDNIIACSVLSMQRSNYIFKN